MIDKTKGTASTAPGTPATGTAKDVAKESGTALNPTQDSQDILEREKQLKAGFSKLGNLQKDFEKKQQEFDSVLKSIPDLLKAQKDLDGLKKAITVNPVEAMRSAGVNPQEAYAKFATGIMSDRPEVQQVMSIKNEVDSLKQALAKFQEAETKKQQETARATLLKKFEDVADSKNARVVKNSKSWALAEHYLAEAKTEAGEPDYERAVEMAESHLTKEIQSLLKSKAFSKEEILSWIEETAEAKPAEKDLAGAKGKPVSAPPPKPSGEAKADPLRRPKDIAEARRRGKEFFKELMKRNSQTG